MSINLIVHDMICYLSLHLCIVVLTGLNLFKLEKFSKRLSSSLDQLYLVVSVLAYVELRIVARLRLQSENFRD